MTDPLDHTRLQERMRWFIKDSTNETHIVMRVLARRIADWNEHQGFWPPCPSAGADKSVPAEFERQRIGCKIALMHSELSEALEGDRKQKTDEHLPQFSSLTVELADAMVRILDFAGHYNLPLAEAFLAKLAFNIDRPYRHGKGY